MQVVNDAFELLDPRNAQAFLKTFASQARRRGEQHFLRGNVQELAPQQPGTLYSCRVEDTGAHNVELEYDPIEGWAGHCSCPTETDCEHIYASMRALLAEHSTAAVRNLSAGVATSASWARSATASDEDAGILTRKLLAAVRRPLTREETQFIRKIQGAFKRCESKRNITHWDFQEMGLPLGGYGWDALHIWPAFPANEYDFWLHVALAAHEHQVPLPEFMLPITDLPAVQERMTRWRRARHIEKWKQRLADAAKDSPQGRFSAQGEIDLRLVIGEKEAFLEWQRPGQAEFQPLRQTHSIQLVNDMRHGDVQFTHEAELLWHLFSHQTYYGNATNARYGDPACSGFLRRVLRTRLLDNRVVNEQRLPLERSTEPLRWQLTAAGGDDDDYILRLTQADGSPAPPILCAIEGAPPLYLTANAVFTGPGPQDHILKTDAENRIPAQAIERVSGVAFLQSLDVELPPALRSRLRTLNYQIAIQCSLRPAFVGSDSEECFIEVIAEAPDGHQKRWSLTHWLEEQKNKRPDPNAPQEAAPRNSITVYDESALAQIPALMGPLGLKPAQGGGGTMRVTKKFPEIFVAWLKSVPQHITVQLAGDLASFSNPEVAGRVSLDVSEAEIDWFDLRVVLNVSDTTLTKEEIKLLLNARGGYVRLGAGKGWRRLQYDLSDDENERLAKLGLSARELSAEPQRLHALQLADDAAKKFLPEQQVEQIQRRASEIKARVAPDLPDGVTAQLRPYQLEGFHFLAYLATNRFGGILADDMGLGKTLQTLAWLLWLRQQNGHQPSTKNHQPSLVVCPKSVMDNWHAEAVRFTPNLRVKSWPASGLNKFTKQLDTADLHVLNYSQLRSLGESLVPIRWQAVILDEGQYIKNPSSQTAQIARALRADHRLILSGTPIENRLLDLWSLMCFTMPGVLSSRAQFARLYDAKGDPFARRRLSARVRPFLLRRTKGQVAKDLPDRIEEDLFCEIEGEQKTLYRAELKRAQQLLLGIKTQKELAKQQFHFLTSLLRLRQICCHPRLVNAETLAAGAKTEALLEQLEPLMEEGQKVLVFSQFVELLQLIRPTIEGRNWPVFYLAGDTENRGELVQKFQSAEGPAVFLISLKAGGFGLNLTAASYVILFDPWWNPAVENQAIDRTHRIGQVNKVIAYRLLIKDSIEEKIRALQKQKKALAEDVLGEERFAQSLTLEDLQFLFAD